MPIVAPGYLSSRALPYVADIFFHERITYFLPTGFTPQEIKSVADFPSYCKAKNIALPRWLWEFNGLYFDNTQDALNCASILAPLRKDRVQIVATVYSRDKAAIDRCRDLLFEHPALLAKFRYAQLDQRLVAREVLSHVLYEVQLAEGRDGAIKYLQQHTTTRESTDWLIAAVMANRLRLFSEPDMHLILFDHSTLDLIQASNSAWFDKKAKFSDSDLVERLKYKIFQEILLPLFGRVDSAKKARTTQRLLEARRDSISALKLACEKIAQDVALLPTTDGALRQKVFTDRLTAQIIEPLSALARKPRRDAVNLVRDFAVDSTVIGGVLAVADSPNLSAVGLALAAGALSVGTKYLFTERQSQTEHPSQLLIDGMALAGVKEQEMISRLQRIVLPPDNSSAESSRDGAT